MIPQTTRLMGGLSLYNIQNDITDYEEIKSQLLRNILEGDN
jgi:hypothetical protein